MEKRPVEIVKYRDIAENLMNISFESINCPIRPKSNIVNMPACMSIDIIYEGGERYIRCPFNYGVKGDDYIYCNCPDNMQFNDINWEIFNYSKEPITEKVPIAEDDSAIE